VALSASGIVFAAVTALTLYVSGRVERPVSPLTRNFLERLSGIVLTAIAVTLLAKGAPRMVIDSLERLREP
jgi:multiple antibiotic resistance protein